MFGACCHGVCKVVFICRAGRWKLCKYDLVAAFSGWGLDASLNGMWNYWKWEWKWKYKNEYDDKVFFIHLERRSENVMETPKEHNVAYGIKKMQLQQTRYESRRQSQTERDTQQIRTE